MLKILPLIQGHLEDAATLVSSRYRKLREQQPLLPDRYQEVSTLLPLLQNIHNSGYPGVAAFQDGQLVGFLTGWLMPEFRGKRSVYSPEWANGAELSNSQRIYEALYSQIAAAWVSNKYVAHYISLFPNDLQALQTWHWMGFGMISVDALRGMGSIESCEVDVTIRRAAEQDLEQVIALQHALWQYMKGTPVYLLTEVRDRSYYVEWLRNPAKVVWLAYLKDEPVGFMRLGPADDDVCTIIYDEKTTSIYAAFTLEKARREGVATALLAHAIRSARASGYQRCAVPFEPMNLLGTHFWLKYFEPVCLSLLRNVDERVL
jgi:GNAT superfamily N-acetyltransferase